VIVAVATGRAGIAVASPRVNAKGGSVRGHAMLRDLSARLGWHFA
jgi:glutaminase